MMLGEPALRRSPDPTGPKFVRAIVGRLKLGGPALRRSPAPPGPKVVTEGVWARDPGDDLDGPVHLIDGVGAIVGSGVRVGLPLGATVGNSVGVWARGAGVGTGIAAAIGVGVGIGEAGASAGEGGGVSEELAAPECMPLHE